MPQMRTWFILNYHLSSTHEHTPRFGIWHGCTGRVYSVIGEMCTRVCVWGGGGIDSSGRLVECGSLNKRIGSDRIDVRRSVAVDCEWRCQLELKSGRSLIVWEWSFREWFGGCWCVDKRVLQSWQPSWGPGARQVVDGLLTWTAVSGCNSGSCRREVIYWTPSSRFRCSLGRDGGRAHSSTTLGCGPGGLCGVHHRANHNAHGNHAHDNERCDFSLCHSIGMQQSRFDVVNFIPNDRQRRCAILRLSFIECCVQFINIGGAREDFVPNARLENLEREARAVKGLKDGVGVVAVSVVCIVVGRGWGCRGRSCRCKRGGASRCCGWIGRRRCRGHGWRI
eukprot:m.72173 g.72173  ORF g.72173 m.72173 type:complete len:337 (-) comp18706_c0_seq3:1397-2407(-)